MDKTHPHRTLELTVLAAEDLRVDRRLNTKNLYVVVRAESINCYTTRTVAECGGDKESHPSWNEKLLVEVPVHARSITLEVKCKTTWSSTTRGAKDVGVARIAMSDLVGGVVPSHCLQFLSYRLRDWEGRRNGVLSFSFRVVKESPEFVLPMLTEKVMPGSSSSSSSSCSCSCGAVVTGIPVMWDTN